MRKPWRRVLLLAFLVAVGLTVAGEAAAGLEEGLVAPCGLQLKGDEHAGDATNDVLQPNSIRCLPDHIGPEGNGLI